MVKKFLISYCIGVLAGSVATYISVKSYYKNLANEEIASIKETVLKRATQMCHKESEKLDDALKNFNREKEKEIENDISKPTSYRTDYTSLYNGVGEVDGVLNALAEAEHPEEEEEKPKKKKKDKGPKIIKAEDWDSDPSYRKVSVYFYYGDGEIADDEDETEMEDLNGKKLGRYKDLIGNCITKYGFDSNDEESVLYVRNEGIHTDFEIIKDFGSFADIKGAE